MIKRINITPTYVIPGVTKISQTKLTLKKDKEKGNSKQKPPRENEDTFMKCLTKEEELNKTYTKKRDIII